MSNLRNAHVSLSLLGVKGHNDGWSKERGIGVGILSESLRGGGGGEGRGRGKGGGEGKRGWQHMDITLYSVRDKPPDREEGQQATSPTTL